MSQWGNCNDGQIKWFAEKLNMILCIWYYELFSKLIKLSFVTRPK